VAGNKHCSPLPRAFARNGLDRIGSDWIGAPCALQRLRLRLQCDAMRCDEVALRCGAIRCDAQNERTIRTAQRMDSLTIELPNE
jgi:hypothetical protein